MATRYGENISLEIYGGSHDEKIGVIVTGLPKGFTFDMDKLLGFMARRAPGSSFLSTPRKEPDMPVFIEGVDDCTITGDTVHAVIYNTNQHSADYISRSFIPRPSHADFSARMKYGESVDLRGGGHFSGRLTAPMCIVGGILLQWLEANGVSVGAHLYSVGNERDVPFDPINVSKADFDKILESNFPALNAKSAEKMKNEIFSAKEKGDSVGAVIECAAIGLPIGLGEHMFLGVENRISQIIFGIPAVKGIEFGSGFEGARTLGSQNNDAFYTDGGNVFTKTNNSGGIIGGMTNGMPIVFRAAMKPTPSIFIEQDSVDLNTMTNVKLSVKGRHDPCVALRAVPVFEAATAIAIYDMMLDK